MHKQSFNSELKVLSDGNTTFDAKFAKVSEHSNIVLERISIANLTNSSSNVTVGIKRGAGILWLETIVLTSDGRYYALVDDFELLAGDEIILRLRGTSANDVINAFMFGYYLN